MQERLRRFIADRTQMLAAMSHDLRTPLTRLRLRAEFIAGLQQRRKMLADLDEMEAMVDATLDFARDDTYREPRSLVNLSVLIEDICEDAADAGGTVTFSGPQGVELHCRPAMARRALVNLVENAVKYGRRARVDLVGNAVLAVITVDDDGPGIPEQEHENVFAPFYRLEGSRNRGTGGVGLGLSVARTIAREHGGDITLVNRDGGGLRVCMELPAHGSIG
jgi:signal transduction histidine kinase